MRYAAFTLLVSEVLKTIRRSKCHRRFLDNLGVCHAHDMDACCLHTVCPLYSVKGNIDVNSDIVFYDANYWGIKGAVLGGSIKRHSWGEINGRTCKTGFLVC